MYSKLIGGAEAPTIRKETQDRLRESFAVAMTESDEAFLEYCEEAQLEREAVMGDIGSQVMNLSDEELIDLTATIEKIKLHRLKMRRPRD